MQTLAMSFNNTVRQRFRHAQEFLAIRSIFKARQSRLRSQILASEGIRPTSNCGSDHSQPRRIVGVFISQRDGHDSLSNQLTQLMLHLTGCRSSPRQAANAEVRPNRRSAPSAESLRHRNCPAVGQTSRPAVDQNIRKKKTVCCGMFVQAKASLLVSNPRRQRICTIARPFVLIKSRIFRASLLQAGRLAPKQEKE